MCSISIHTPKKGVTVSLIPFQMSEKFQSTLPRREWLKFPCCSVQQGNFNPHSQEGSDQSVISPQFLITNFNPHSQEGSDDIFTPLQLSPVISIHTPKKGVTTGIGRMWIEIFDFNPHSQEGSDDLNNGIGKVMFYISIHTPKKGVTYFHQLSCQAWIISIHTPKKGVTAISSSA